MNTNNEENKDTPINSAIAEALIKLNKKEPKDGVDLLEITKKLASKKFGRKVR